MLGLGRVGHVDQYDVTMGFEPRIRSELAGTDLKLELHRRVIAGHAALAHVGRTLGEGAYEREHSRPGGPDAAALAVPRQIEYVRVCLVGVPAGQREPAVLLTPRFDVRQEMKLGFFCHPPGFAECRDQLARAGNELRRTPDPLPAIIAIPTNCHSPTL